MFYPTCDIVMSGVGYTTQNFIYHSHTIYLSDREHLSHVNSRLVAFISPLVSYSARCNRIKVYPFQHNLVQQDENVPGYRTVVM